MNDLEQKIASEKEYLENFQLEITEGTKKMIKDFHERAVVEKNKYIQERIEEYEKLNEDIKNILNSRKEKYLPKDKEVNTEELESKIESTRNILKLINPFNDYLEILSLNYYLTKLNIKENINLDYVNEVINNILNVFKGASIVLTKESFNYSSYAYKYMESYLNKKTDIKETFENLYWSCPEIIIHLNLNFKYLIKKYEKELTKYASLLIEDTLKKNNLTSDNIYNKYKNYCDEYENLLNKDEVGLTSDFISGNLNPGDYLISANTRINSFNSLLPKAYDELETHERDNFISDVKKIYCVLNELENYSKFKDLITDLSKKIKGEYLEADYKNKLKEIATLEAKRMKVVKEILPHKSLFGYKDKMNDGLKLKLQNDYIIELNTLYEDLENLNIKKKIKETLVETSDINTSLKLILGNYNYYKILISKMDNINEADYYNDLVKFVYDVNNSFSSSIAVTFNDDIADIIYNKYSLLNLKFTKENLTDNIAGFKSLLLFIIRTINIENTSVKFENLVLYNEIVKLLK